MEIKITKTLTGDEYWREKKKSVIFVKTEKERAELYKALRKQDFDWQYYQDVLQILPKDINDENFYILYLKYCGNTRIYDIAKMRQEHDFIFFQKL